MQLECIKKILQQNFVQKVHNELANELTESWSDIPASRIEVETKIKLARNSRIVLCVKQSRFMFVQFQSNSDFMPILFPLPHTTHIYIISRNQGKLFFTRLTIRIRGVGGEARLFEILLYIFTHIPLMYVASSKHMWHNKAPSARKINFIFSDFPLGKKVFIVDEKKTGKIIAILNAECNELLTQFMLENKKYDDEKKHFEY